MEDGVEEDNTLSFNLAAHVHFMDSPAIGSGQNVPVVNETASLTLPADITASGFYITNMHNDIIGNAASGGWAGFAFPVLQTPVGPHRDDPLTRLSERLERSMVIVHIVLHGGGVMLPHFTLVEACTTKAQLCLTMLDEIRYLETVTHVKKMKSRTHVPMHGTK